MADNRDWTEDAAHENGNYLRSCESCKRRFIGHKRRIQCKACYNESNALPRRDDSGNTTALSDLLSAPTYEAPAYEAPSEPPATSDFDFGGGGGFSGGGGGDSW